MATASPSPAPTQTHHQILDHLASLQHLNALIAAANLQSLIQDTGEPMHFWPVRLLHLYNQLKHRVLKTTYQFMTALKRTKQCTTIYSIQPGRPRPSKAATSPLRTPAATDSAPKKRSSSLTKTSTDYNALKATWFKAYSPKDEAETRLVQQLVDADWFLERANRTVAEVEAHIYNSGYMAINWSDDHHLRLVRFQRYQTAKANIVLKCRKAVEDYRKNRTNEKVKAEKHEVYKEKSKPAPSVEEMIEEMKQRKLERDRISALLQLKK